MTGFSIQKLSALGDSLIVVWLLVVQSNTSNGHAQAYELLGVLVCCTDNVFV